MTTLSVRLRFLLLPLAMLGATSAAHAWQAEPKRCQLAQLMTLPVRYTGPGLSLTIEGRIDGTAADMLIDTGSSSTILTRTATERRGLSLRSTNARAYGIGGAARIYSAQIKEFKAGPASITNSRVRVLGDFGTAPSFEAILGAPFLLQSDLEISLATKEIKFFKPSNCDDANLAYWDEDAVVLPFRWGSSSHTNPEFKVLINGKEVMAVIDSGAATTVMTRRAAEKAGLRMDTPGALRVGEATGIGTKRVAHWSATLGTLQIGRETIHNADIGVIDTGELDVDLLLGADFLRSHRVMFAMSQRKLYITYVGGEALGQRRRIEPWLQQEADGGNGDAQMMVASMHGRGHGVPIDAAQAQAWVDKAAAGGHARANLMVGQRLMKERRYADAAVRIRQALDGLPGERSGALMLYTARMYNNEAELGRRELAAAFTHDRDDWPGPIADFYLGKLDEDKLLALAREESEHALRRTCQARFVIAERHRFSGDAERATQAMAQAPECRQSPQAAP
jgi:clan AA aspartic protease (TIGR02281 family)